MNATGWMEYVLVFSTQRGNLKLLAIATPHQSRQNIGSEMPIFHRDSFPPGEAKGCKPLACTLCYRAYALNRVLAEIRGYGRILSAPTERVLFILLYVLKSNLSY